MKTKINLILILAGLLLVLGCEKQSGDNTMEQKLEKFIAAHLEKVKPLDRQAALASWQAACSGKAQDYDKAAQLRLETRQIYSNAEDFAFLQQCKESGSIKNPVLARQLTELHNDYLRNQIDPELLKQIVTSSSEIEKRFSTFRGTIDGKKVSDNDIKETLKSEKDSSRRHQTWRASKQVGAEVADDLIKLVKLRNQAARSLGFDNFHTLSLTVTEQDPQELDKIFQELYELTNEPFAQIKSELDGRLAAGYGISPDELMPWHYHDPFFQETPMIYDLNLDDYFADQDIKELSEKYFAGINLPVDSVLANSDLYERDGKNPGAFCTDIDREGDVRILCNLRKTDRWMETQLHELGHAVYDIYHDRQVPYLLRHPVHSFTTEGIAMFFGRLSRNPAWMQQILGLSDEQRAEIEKVSDKYARLKQLIFIRWDMVMYNFEKQLYANPDQDLNTLWWDMVEKYQLVKRPPDRDQPDWAAKVHFTEAPCYYHNYGLGEMFASQLHHHLVHNVLKLDSDGNLGYVEKVEVGDYLRQKVFEAGSLYHWNEMIARATGEELSPKYFVEQFVK